MSKDVVITANWMDSVSFDDKGLVNVIAQDHKTSRVLMVAWMNREALEITAQTRFATYFSRSRNKLWHKGEESGNQQKVKEIRLDCDGDVLILIVEQMGGLAVPLLGKDGRPYAAISIAGLKDRIVGRLGMLVPALEKISKDLEGL